MQIKQTDGGGSDGVGVLLFIRVGEGNGKKREAGVEVGKQTLYHRYGNGTA